MLFRSENLEELRAIGDPETAQAKPDQETAGPFARMRQLVNLTLPYVLEQLLKCRTVKTLTAEPVFDIVTHNRDLVLASHSSIISL